MSTEAASPSRRRTPSQRGAGDALRLEIVEAASALLAESGDAAGMSLRAVARRVGIATTSIYLHFADLDELILAVKLRRFDELTKSLQAAMDLVGADPVDRVRALGQAYVSFGLQNPGHYRVMFSASLRFLPTDSSGRLIGLEAFHSLAREVAGAIGRPTDDPTTHLVATELWTFVHGVVHLRTARPLFPWPDLDVQVNDLVDRILGAR